MAIDDDSWDWVVPPDKSSVSAYNGVDLSGTISVGNRISQLRLAAGMSVQDLEDYTGIRTSDLLAVEAGLLKVGATMAGQLAMVLGVTASEIQGL